MTKHDAAAASPDAGRLRASTEEPPGELPRVVFVQAPVVLATLVRRDDDRWVALIAGVERTLAADACVDPALLEDAMRRGARVVVDQSGEPTIAGVVATQRALVIDREGVVDAEVEQLTVTARQEVLLRAPGAFLRARRAEVEIFGNKVLTRARDLAKTLAAMIELN